MEDNFKDDNTVEDLYEDSSDSEDVNDLNQEDTNNSKELEDSDDSVESDPKEEKKAKKAKKEKKEKKAKKKKKYSPLLYLFMLFFLAVIPFAAYVIAFDNARYIEKKEADETTSVIRINKESGAYQSIKQNSGLKDEELDQEIRNVFFKDEDFKDSYFKFKKLNKLDRINHYYFKDLLKQRQIDADSKDNVDLLKEELKKYNIREGNIKLHAPRNYHFFKAIANISILDLFMPYDTNSKKEFSGLNEFQGIKGENDKFYPLYIEEVVLNRDTKVKGKIQTEKKYNRVFNFSLLNILKNYYFETQTSKKTEYYLIFHAPRDNEFLRLKINFQQIDFDNEWVSLKKDNQLLSVFPKGLITTPQDGKGSNEFLHREILRVANVLNLEPSILNKTNFDPERLRDYFFTRSGEKNYKAINWFYLSNEIAFKNNRVNELKEIITTDIDENEVSFNLIYTDRDGQEHILTKLYHPKNTNFNWANLRTIKDSTVPSDINKGGEELYDALKTKGRLNYLSADTSSGKNYPFPTDVNYNQQFETTEWQHVLEGLKKSIKNGIEGKKIQDNFNLYAAIAREKYNVYWYLNKEEYEKDKTANTREHYLSVSEVGRNESIREYRVSDDKTQNHQRFHYFYFYKDNETEFYKKFNSGYDFTEEEGDISFIGFISSSITYRFINLYDQSQSYTKELFYYKEGYDPNLGLVKDSAAHFDLKFREASDQLKTDNYFKKWITYDNYQQSSPDATEAGKDIELVPNNTLNNKTYTFYAKFEYKRFNVNYLLEDNTSTYEKAKNNKDNKFFSAYKYTKNDIESSSSAINWYEDDQKGNTTNTTYYKIDNDILTGDLDSNYKLNTVLKPLAAYTYDAIKNAGSDESLDEISISSEDNFDKIEKYDFYLKRKTYKLNILYSKRTIKAQDYIKVYRTNDSRDYETTSDYVITKDIKYQDSLRNILSLEEKKSLNEVLSYVWEGEFSTSQGTIFQTNARYGETNDKISENFTEKIYEHVNSSDEIDLYPIYAKRKVFRARIYLPSENYTADVAKNPDGEIVDSRYLHYYTAKAESQDDKSIDNEDHSIKPSEHRDFHEGGSYYHYNISGTKLKIAGFYENPQLTQKIIDNTELSLREDLQPIFTRYYYPINIDFYDFRKGDTKLFSRNKQIIRYPGEALDFNQDNIAPLDANKDNTLAKYLNVSSIDDDDTSAYDSATNGSYSEYELNHTFSIDKSNPDFNLQGKSLKFLCVWSKVYFELRYKLYKYDDDISLTENLIKGTTTKDATEINPKYTDVFELDKSSVEIDDNEIKREYIRNANNYNKLVKDFLAKDYTICDEDSNRSVSSYYRNRVNVYYRQNVYRINFKNLETDANSSNYLSKIIDTKTFYYISGQKINKNTFNQIKSFAQKDYQFLKDGSLKAYSEDDILKSLFDNDFDYDSAIRANIFTKLNNVLIGSVKQKVYELNLMQFWKKRTTFTVRFKQVFLDDGDINKPFDQIKIDSAKYLDRDIRTNFNLSESEFDNIYLDTKLRDCEKAKAVYTSLAGDPKYYPFSGAIENDTLFKAFKYYVAPVSGNQANFDNLNQLKDVTTDGIKLSDYLIYDPNSQGENDTPEYIEYYIFYRRSINIVGSYTELGVEKNVNYSHKVYVGDTIDTQHFGEIFYTDDNTGKETNNTILKINNANTYTITINDQKATTKTLALSLKFRPIKIKYYIELAKNNWKPGMEFSYKEVESILYRDENNTTYNGVGQDNIIRNVFSDVISAATYYKPATNNNDKVQDFINAYYLIDKTKNNEVNEFIPSQSNNHTLTWENQDNPARVFYRLREFKLAYRKAGTTADTLLFGDNPETEYKLDNELVFKMRTHYNLFNAEFRYNGKLYSLTNFSARRELHDKYFAYFYDNTNTTPKNYFAAPNGYLTLEKNTVLIPHYMAELDNFIFATLYDRTGSDKKVGEVKFQIENGKIKPVSYNLDDPNYGVLKDKLYVGTMQAISFEKDGDGYKELDYSLAIYKGLVEKVSSYFTRYYLITYRVVDEEGRLSNNLDTVNYTGVLKDRYLATETMKFPTVNNITINNYKEQFVKYVVYENNSVFRDNQKPNNLFNFSDPAGTTYTLEIRIVYKQKVAFEYEFINDDGSVIPKDEVDREQAKKLDDLKKYKGDLIGLPQGNNAPQITGVRFDKYLIKTGTQFLEYNDGDSLTSANLEIKNNRYTLIFKVYYTAPYVFNYEFKLLKDINGGTANSNLINPGSLDINSLTTASLFYVHKTFGNTYQLPDELPKLNFDGWEYQFVKYHFEGNNQPAGTTINLSGPKDKKITLFFAKKIKLVYQVVEGYNTHNVLGLGYITNSNLINETFVEQNTETELPGALTTNTNDYKFSHYQVGVNKFSPNQKHTFAYKDTLNNVISIQAVLNPRIKFDFYYKDTNKPDAPTKDNTLDFISNPQLRATLLGLKGPIQPISSNTHFILDTSNPLKDPGISIAGGLHKFIKYRLRYRYLDSSGTLREEYLNPQGNTSHFIIPNGAVLEDNTMDVILEYEQEINITYQIKDLFTNLTYKISDLALSSDGIDFLNTTHFTKDTTIEFNPLASERYQLLYYQVAGDTTEYAPYTSNNTLKITNAHNGKVITCYVIRKIKINYQIIGQNFNDQHNYPLGTTLTQTELDFYSKYQTLTFNSSQRKFTYRIYQDFRYDNHAYEFYLPRARIYKKNNNFEEFNIDPNYLGANKERYITLDQDTYKNITSVDIKFARHEKVEAIFELAAIPSDKLSNETKALIKKRYFRRGETISFPQPVIDDKYKNGYTANWYLGESNFGSTGNPAITHHTINTIYATQAFYLNWSKKQLTINYEFLSNDYHLGSLGENDKFLLNKNRVLEYGQTYLLERLSDNQFAGYYTERSDGNYDKLDTNHEGKYTFDTTSISSDSYTIYLVFNSVVNIRYYRMMDGVKELVYTTKRTYTPTNPISSTKVLYNLGETQIDTKPWLTKPDLNNNISTTLFFHQFDSDKFSNFNVYASSIYEKDLYYKEKEYQITYKAKIDYLDGEFIEESKTFNLKPSDIMPYSNLLDWLAPSDYYNRLNRIYYQITSTAPLGDPHYIATKDVVINKDNKNLLHTLFHDSRFYTNEHNTSAEFELKYHDISTTITGSTINYKYAFYDYYTGVLLDNKYLEENIFSNQDLDANYEVVNNKVQEKLKPLYGYEMYVRKYDLDSNTTSLTRFNAFNKYNLKRLIVEEKDSFNQTNYIAKIYLKLTKRKYKIRYYLMDNLDEFKENFQNQTPQEVIEYYADEVVKEYLPSALNFAYQNFVYDMKVVGDNVSSSSFNHENYTKKAYEYPRENSGYDVINIGFESKKRRYTVTMFTETPTFVNSYTQGFTRKKIQQQIITDDPNYILSEDNLKEKVGVKYKRVVNISRYQKSISDSLVGDNKEFVRSNIINLEQPISSYFLPSNNPEGKIDLKLLSSDEVQGSSIIALTFQTNSYDSDKYEIKFTNFKVRDALRLDIVINLLSYIYQSNNDSIIKMSSNYFKNEELTNVLDINKSIKRNRLNGGNIYFKRLVEINIYSIKKNGVREWKQKKVVSANEYNNNFDSMLLDELKGKTFIIDGEVLKPSDYQNMSFKQFIKKFTKGNRYDKKLYYYEQ